MKKPCEPPITSLTLARAREFEAEKLSLKAG